MLNKYKVTVKYIHGATLSSFIGDKIVVAHSAQDAIVQVCPQYFKSNEYEVEVEPVEDVIKL